MIKLVIFDLDGTVCDTLDGITKAMNLAFMDNNLSENSRDWYLKGIGNGAKELVKESLPVSNKTEEMVNKVLEKFIKYYELNWGYELKVYPGMDEVIKLIKQKGITIAVNTNKPHHIAVEVIKKFYDGSVISKIVGSSNEYARKPNPYGVKLILDQFNVLPSECLYVGDSSVDILTAENASIISVSVPWGYGKKEDLNVADYCITSPMDLIEIIEKQNAV